MLNMFKSGLTKQSEKLVANTVHTSQLNKVETCLIKICWQGGLKFVFSKWLRSIIDKLDEP